MSHRIRILVFALSTITTSAFADLNADFNRCRAEILSIGDDPRAAPQQYCLGLSYAFAINHRKDRAQAAVWFRRAASQGYAPAQTILGYMLERGDGVGANPVEAAQWYRRAADQNHDEGLFNMGRAYENGIGVARDLTKAREWYQRAASLGLATAGEALANLGQSAPAPTSADTQFQRGAQLYEAKNFSAALAIFAGLAQSGNARAQLQVGYQYEFGEGVAANAVEAAKWYRKSAEQGYARAQNNLGALYEDGRGVPEDWVQAARWFHNSATQGNATGQFRLGRAYQFGIGVPQSRGEAIRWFNEAASQGDDQSNYWVNQLRSSGNFIGFRTDEEQQLVIANKLRTSTQLVFAEPRGVTFRNSAERFGYLRALRANTDRDEAQTAWSLRNDRYQACKRGETGETTCADPGPSP